MSNSHAHDRPDRQPPPTAPARVAGYARVARADASGALAAAGQEALVRACAADHGWPLVGVFTDRGRCRTARQPALAAARAGRYDVLLVDGPDRLSRHSEEMLALLTALGQAGVRVRYTGERDRPARPATASAARWPQ
jgi:site-specific DNA recombinase